MLPFYAQAVPCWLLVPMKGNHGYGALWSPSPDRSCHSAEYLATLGQSLIFLRQHPLLKHQKNKHRWVLKILYTVSMHAKHKRNARLPSPAFTKSLGASFLA